MIVLYCTVLILYSTIVYCTLLVQYGTVQSKFTMALMISFMRHKLTGVAWVRTVVGEKGEAGFENEEKEEE